MELCTLISTHLNTQIQLNSATRFTTDLGLDSLQVMDLVAAIEERFNVSVPFEAIPTLATVGDAAGFIFENQGGSSAA